MRGARLAHIHPLNVPVPYKYKVLWTVKHYYSNMPAHIYSVYFIVTLFAVIYIPEVSTVFSGTQYRLNYGVYFQTIHPAVQLGNNYIIGSINISLPSPRVPIESHHIKDPCKTFLERRIHSRSSSHPRLQQNGPANQRAEQPSSKYCVQSEIHLGVNSKDHCHHSQPHTYQPTSRQKISKEFFGLLPFIGEMSNVLFGTATEKDVRNQQVGVDKAVQKHIGVNSRDHCHHSQPHTYQPTSKQKNSKEFFRVASLHWQNVQCIIWDCHREGCPQSTGRRR